MKKICLTSCHGALCIYSLISIIFILNSLSPAYAARPTPNDGQVGASSDSSFFANSSGFALQNPRSAVNIPENNISCVGNFPDLKLPLLGDGFDPNQASMQKLCAKTQYGGGPTGHNAGGYCWARPGTFSYHSVDNDTTGDVGFESGQASTQLQNPRFLLACFYRCWCSHDLRNPSIQPKSRYAYFRTSMVRSLFSYELQLDIDNDFTTPRLLKMGKQGTKRVKSTRVPERSEAFQMKAPTTRMGRATTITLDPGNEIECRGSLPNFVLPSPYAMSDFKNMQELCATQLSGGNLYANAGGYCHRSDTPNGPSNKVWFSDDQTPRHEWTWVGGNFFASASIRYICWRNCACKNVKPTRDNTTTPLWAFVHGHELTQRPNGAIVIQQETGPVPVGSERETQVLPSQNGGVSPSGTCGANADEFCPQAWPSAVYGEVPHAPPDTTDIIQAKPPNKNKTVCGNTCDGPADCSSSTTQYGCSCALPTPDDARSLGLDPVAPVAVCLALFSANLNGKPYGGKRALSYEGIDDTRSFNKLLGRGPYLNEEGIPHTCKCNATFLADECCTSRSGIVRIF